MSTTPELPSEFTAAAQAVWQADCQTRLNGARDSLAHGKRIKSEQTAYEWLVHTYQAPFLNERGLRSVVFAALRGHDGNKAVDFVALRPEDGALILVEAKAQLDSDAIASVMGHKRSDGIEALGKGKFDDTLRALQEFYAKGEQRLPPVGELVVTCHSIRISGHSRWNVDDGRLLSRNKQVYLGTRPVRVLVVPETAT
jgi:hypothetical protein